MKVLLARVRGFCPGVKRAVVMAIDSGKGSCVLGQLVHNPQVNDELKNRGVQSVNSLYGVKEGGQIIFRAHGEAPLSYDIAKGRSLTVVDATCPHVRKAQEATRQLAAEGYAVVIIGDPSHPEVKSIKAWGGSGAIVVSSVTQARALPAGGRYGIVAQTTCPDETFAEISSLIARGAAEHKITRTICSATKDRQEAAAELAGQVDAVVVVGGKDSANTRRLQETAGKYCNRTVLVETAVELSRELLAGAETVGVTAGASTPDWVIEEVVKKMEDMESMDEMLKEADRQRVPAAGEIIEGMVVNVGRDEVFVHINSKKEGVIPRQEAALTPPEDLSELFRPGDAVTVLVLADKDDGLLLSKVRADQELALSQLNKAYEEQSFVEVFVDALTKGGVTCNVFGVRGFIPASRLSLEHMDDLSPFVGQTLTAQIIELDLSGSRKKVILSRRELLKQERADKEREFYAQIKTGEKYKGKVSRITDFGAFIDLGGVDGLLHVSAMSWDKVKHPADILRVGEEIEVLAQKVDAENKRISLSMRELLQDPWLAEIENFKEGRIVPGKISKLTKFGAFVFLAKGIEGLVHISEIADERVERTEDVLRPKQDVRVKILKIDKKNKKVSLSIAQAKKEEEKKELKEFIGDQEEFKTSIGSKFDLNKVFDD